eukprot:465456-Alexandrium_andersonii.AAC.1
MWSCDLPQAQSDAARARAAALAGGWAESRVATELTPWGCRLRIAVCDLRIPDCGVRIARGSGFRIADVGPRTVD